MKRIIINQTPSVPGGAPSVPMTGKFFIRSGDEYNCPPLEPGEVVELEDEEADSCLKNAKGYVVETTETPTRSLIDKSAYRPEHPEAVTPGTPQSQSQDVIEQLVAKLDQQAERVLALEAKLEAALEDTTSEDSASPESLVSPARPQSVEPIPIPTLAQSSQEAPQSEKRTRRAVKKE